MIDLRTVISRIEKLLADGSDSSVTYAALECRLAIERICYERLRVAHDYISHEDIRRWQPREVVNILIQEVDANAASTFTLSISEEPTNSGGDAPTLAEYQAMEFVPVGTKIGFNANKLGKLWNALANLALHVSAPISKAATVRHYGDKDKIVAKVREALAEIKEISNGTLLSTGFGTEVSFDCYCGVKNKRKLALLKAGQTVNCINPNCDESYEFVSADASFGRRALDVACKHCGTVKVVPRRMIEKVKYDQFIHYQCDGCGDTVYIQWKPMQAQRSQAGPLDDSAGETPPIVMPTK